MELQYADHHHLCNLTRQVSGLLPHVLKVVAEQKSRVKSDSLGLLKALLWLDRSLEALPAFFTPCAELHI